jgi:carbonic anhydrase
MEKLFLIPVLLLAFVSAQASEKTHSTDKAHSPPKAQPAPKTKAAPKTYSAPKAHSAGKAHWGYSGATGPENWAKLSPKFADCAGRNQSPIDLRNFVDANLPQIKFNYQPGQEVINNGHTIKVGYSASGGSMEVDGMTFRLLQYHFHAPSENHIMGKSFAMEAHLVHANDKGELAVVAIMFEEGKENMELAKVWKVMPKEVGGKKLLPTATRAYRLLPSDRDYYRFSGSLTTPPCTEGVRWIVIKQPATASAKQIKDFEAVMGHPNNRPIQPLNARAVLE